MDKDSRGAVVAPPQKPSIYLPDRAVMHAQQCRDVFLCKAAGKVKQFCAVSISFA
jgi:hypothetical protein